MTNQEALEFIQWMLDSKCAICLDNICEKENGTCKYEEALKIAIECIEKRVEEEMIL